MPNNLPEEIPVYLFLGFLESGKTKFIQETLCDERFNKGEKTLLLVCEEGVEEYEPDEVDDTDEAEDSDEDDEDDSDDDDEESEEDEDEESSSEESEED